MAVEDIVIGTRVDTSGFKKGLKGLSSAIGKGSKGIASMGASVTAFLGPVGIATTAVIGFSGALVKLAGDTAEMGDEAGKASQRLGVSLKTYQKLQSAAQHAGASMTTMATGMRTMLRRLTSAQDGNARAIDTFEQLGVAIRDTNGEVRDQEDIFSDTLMSLSKMSNEAERNALAQKALGRSASELAPLFNEGADAVERYLEANESAVIVSDDLAESSARYSDSLQTTGEKLKQAKNTALEPFIESMADLMENFQDSATLDVFIKGISDIGLALDLATTSANDLFSGLDWLFAGGDKKSEVNQKAFDVLRVYQGTIQDTTDKIRELRNANKEAFVDSYEYMANFNIDKVFSQAIGAGLSEKNAQKMVDLYKKNLETALKGDPVSVPVVATSSSTPKKGKEGKEVVRPSYDVSLPAEFYDGFKMVRGKLLGEILSFNDDIEEINATATQKAIDDAQARADAITDITVAGFNAVASVVSSASDYAISKDEAELDSWKKKEQGKLDSTRMSERRRAEAQKKLDAEEEKRQKEIDKKRAQARVREMWSQTAMGITGAWAQAFATNAPAWAPIVAGVSTGALLTNAGIQTAEAMQGFEDGGVVMGNSMTGDNLTVGMNSAEAVFNDRQFKDLIDFIKPENGDGGVTVVVENLSGSSDDLDNLKDSLLQLVSNGQISQGVFA